MLYYSSWERLVWPPSTELSISFEMIANLPGSFSCLLRKALIAW